MAKDLNLRLVSEAFPPRPEHRALHHPNRIVFVAPSWAGKVALPHRVQAVRPPYGEHEIMSKNNPSFSALAGTRLDRQCPMQGIAKTRETMSKNSHRPAPRDRLSTGVTASGNLPEVAPQPLPANQVVYRESGLIQMISNARSPVENSILRSQEATILTVPGSG